MVNYIIDNRDTGKSTKLIKAALDDPKGIIVVPTKYVLESRVRLNGVPRDRIMVCDITRIYERGKINLYFDDIECIMTVLTNQTVKMMTGSLEE